MTGCDVMIAFTDPFRPFLSFLLLLFRFVSRSNVDLLLESAFPLSGLLHSKSCPCSIRCYSVTVFRMSMAVN